MDILKLILSSLAPWIDELHVVNNGFDRLPYTQMREALTCFPHTIKKLVTGSKEFALRNDGIMVSFNGLRNTGFFHSHKQFYHQREFAGLRIIMMQLIQYKGFNLDIVLIILDYVVKGNPAELKRMGDSISTLIISCKPPLHISLKDQEQCLDAIQQRITQRQPDDNCLDLSRCGLNRLKDDEMMNKISAKIETLPITTLNLRGNGLLHNNKTMRVFFALRRLISNSIQYIDLSDNGFEHKSVDELEKLLACLPVNVKVRLENEPHMSPALQIARRQWPDSYFELTNGNDISELQEARELLNDYTKGDSAFLRFVCGHLDRHFPDEVARLVHYIDSGLITSVEDLSYELGQIKLVNQAGSLARRFSFFTCQKPVPEKLLKIGNGSEDYNRIELNKVHSKTM